MPAAATPDLDASIFKAYDIRGVVGRTLSGAAAWRIGCAFAQASLAAGVGEVAVGRDGRLSGPLLHAALVAGLQAGGARVLDLGLVTTPMVYFACATTTARSGVMITGSHNPPDYNGFKMVLAGEAIHGDAIQRLRAAASLLTPPDRDWAAAPLAPPTGEGIVEHDIAVDYIARIAADLRLARPMQVAVDAGNGVAGAFAGRLLRALGCQVTELHCEVDGRFPNHHPDPAQLENLRDLQDELARGPAELGLAFDGDGDRLGVVTKSGAVIFPDRQLLLYAQDLLARRPGAAIVFDVKCSASVAPWIERHGGQPIMWKTGHSLIKAKMRETGALLAGEMSGHVFWGERWYGFDDGLYTACRLLEIASRHADPGALLESLPATLATPEINLPTAEGAQHAVCAALQRHALSGGFPRARACSTIDGVRAEYDGGFALARPSNTTPVIVCRLEARDRAALAQQAGELAAALATVDAEVGATARARLAEALAAC
jgi:phosphomannomutase/phosphoglucomutase